MAGRFSISVPGRRGPNDPWFRIGTLDVTTTVFVILTCVASMFVWALEGPEHPILGKLILWPDLVLDGQIWRVATWPVPNAPDIWLVIMLAVFWYFGTEVERLLGRVRFAVFIGLVTVIPGIVGALIDLPQWGIRPVELCVFLLFVAEYPFVRFFFGIPGWVIGAVILGIEILQLLGDRNEKGIVFLFVALAVAAITARSMGLLGNYPWVPAVPIGALGRSRAASAVEVQAARSPAQQRWRRRRRRSVDGIEPERSDRDAAPASAAQRRRRPTRPSSTRSSTRSRSWGWTASSAPRRRASTSCPSGCAAAAERLRQLDDRL